MNVVIVMPSYNEAGSIERTIVALASEIPKVKNHKIILLVVDGNSPDGTAKVVNKLKEQYPWVELYVEKEKKGLGSAYFTGFTHAMKKLNADIVLEMDADYQHDPKDISRLIAAIDKGADHVIGCRYMTGGGIPKEWAFYRKFLSYVGNIVAKIILGIWEVDDYTSGFKATRVKGFLDQLDFSTMESTGFAYKMDVLFRLKKLKANFAQVPIKFLLRESGDSKMETNNMFDSLRVVITLRLRESQNFIKFCVVGFAGLFVDAGLFNLLINSAALSNYSAGISGGLAMLVTFILNNYWSFKGHAIAGFSQKVKGFIIYVASSSVPIFVRSKLVFYAILWFGKSFLVYNTAFFLGIILGLIWNFVVYSKIIWKQESVA